MDALAVARHLQPDGASTWANLGFWGEAQEETSYPRAARALAEALGRAANLEGAEAVLDVGVGAGDQLSVWGEAFGVAHVTALEPEARVHAAARARLAAEGIEGVTLKHAGADDVAALPAAAFDRVLALDCAYHFPSRDRFFADARARLRPGGWLGLTDLVAGPRAGFAASALRSVFGVRQRLDDVEAYRARLEAAGFGEIAITNWTAPVLGGFARWVARHPRAWARPMKSALAVGATALAARTLGGWGVVDYIGVAARTR